MKYLKFNLTVHQLPNVSSDVLRKTDLNGKFGVLQATDTDDFQY